MRASAPIVLAATAAIAGVLPGCGQPKTQGPPRATAPGRQDGRVADSTLFTTGDYEGCPPEGNGGDYHLNRLKNRDVPPPGHQLFTIRQLLENRPRAAIAMGRTDRAFWTEEARAEVAEWESTGAVIEGHLLRAKLMGPESCNCTRKDRRDYHVWIGEEPGGDRSRSVIAEVSPRMLPAHPNWRLRILSRLARQGARVRLTGWLLWDQEHPEQVGLTRGTQWELHPIHEIQVFSGGRWRDLDGDRAQ